MQLLDVPRHRGGAACARRGDERDALDAQQKLPLRLPRHGAGGRRGPRDWRIPFEESGEGEGSFTIPVAALDAGVPCAAYSRSKELWYDRTLLFRADSLPEDAFREGFFVTAESLGLEDGDYTVSVSLGGGSGRASVEPPCALWVEGGQAFARIVWGSKNYDLMCVGDKEFTPVNAEGNSVFEIPVTRFDRPMAVKARTVAMSEPHLIDYTLRFASDSLERGV